MCLLRRKGEASMCVCVPVMVCVYVCVHSVGVGEKKRVVSSRERRFINKKYVQCDKRVNPPPCKDTIGLWSPLL